MFDGLVGRIIAIVHNEAVTVPDEQGTVSIAHRADMVSNVAFGHVQGEIAHIHHGHIAAALALDLAIVHIDFAALCSCSIPRLLSGKIDEPKALCARTLLPLDHRAREYLPKPTEQLLQIRLLTVSGQVLHENVIRFARAALQSVSIRRLSIFVPSPSAK